MVSFFQLDSAITRPVTISAIVPARNEAPCIAAVVAGLSKLRRADGAPLLAEIVVVDNGSDDGTDVVAERAGARVVLAPEPGYGRACWEGVQQSGGDVLLFVDGDGAADPLDATALIAALAGGADLVIGVRVRPDLGAMSVTQRFGNGLACLLMRLVWRMPVDDLGPYRAISRSAFDALELRDRKFGWTVEMQVRAHLLGLRVVQVPVRWHNRSAGHSKISGTVAGVIGAGVGILGMIGKLYWREHRRPERITRPGVSGPLPKTAANGS